MSDMLMFHTGSLSLVPRPLEAQRIWPQGTQRHSSHVFQHVEWYNEDRRFLAGLAGEQQGLGQQIV